jgi:hypothetical protein
MTMFTQNMVRKAARFHFCINIWGCLALSMQFIPGLHGIGHVTTRAHAGRCIPCSLTPFSMQQGISGCGVHPAQRHYHSSCPPMLSSWPLPHPFLPPTKMNGLWKNVEIDYKFNNRVQGVVRT